jgi:hypothetical protein
LDHQRQGIPVHKPCWDRRFSQLPHRFCTMVSPKLHQASIWHAGHGDRLTQIVPVGLDTQCQIRNVVGWHSWARDRMERVKLAKENFDDTLSWGTHPPNHCNLAGVVELTCLSDQRYGYATRLCPDCKSARPPRQAGFDVRCRTPKLTCRWKRERETSGRWRRSGAVPCSVRRGCRGTSPGLLGSEGPCLWTVPRRDPLLLRIPGRRRLH